ncbi:MAG TPA: hypothetical protein VJK06_07505, partial [Methyloceanibacter sp.]|nr:hypothetical protein [Methyloceanibacter sp.]
ISEHSFHLEGHEEHEVLFLNFVLFVSFAIFVVSKGVRVKVEAVGIATGTFAQASRVISVCSLV